MEYLDNQHRILKYLCKFKYGVLKAHKPCLVPAGENYSEIKNNEKATYKDAVVDLDKLKSLFAKRKIMTSTEFENSLEGLINNGFLTKDYFLTKDGVNKNKEVFNVHYNTPEFIASLEEQGKTLETANLLFKN